MWRNFGRWNAYFIKLPNHQVCEVRPKCPSIRDRKLMGIKKLSTLWLHEEIEYRISGQLSHEVASTFRWTVHPSFSERHTEENRLGSEDSSKHIHRASMGMNCTEAMPGEWLVCCYIISHVKSRRWVQQTTYERPDPRRARRNQRRKESLDTRLPWISLLSDYSRWNQNSIQSCRPCWMWDTY